MTGPGAASVTLGLFLLPGGRPGRRLAGAADDDPAVARVVMFLFFASTRATSASGRHRRAKIQTGVICISHEDKGRKKTLDGGRR
jgi:hypothetical protein